VNLSHLSHKTETVNYKVWHDKDVQTLTISRSAGMTGRFANTTQYSGFCFDEITRMEFLYVNWDPRTNECHTNADYSTDELKDAITLLEKNLTEFATHNAVSLE
jgi:hypothetical protein